MRINTVKRQLQAGEPSIGTWLSLGSPLAAEQLGYAGFDWLNIDQEHAGIDATLTLNILQAISITPAVPMCRIPWNSGDWIKRALDAGAYGLVIPMVNSGEEAEAAVSAAMYPPRGIRSVGGVRPRLYGGPDYVEHANEEILVVVQIEHATGVKNAEAILSTPGVDAYFVGPNDLCQSMGLAPSLEPDFPQFWEALDTIKKIADKHGVAAGIHVASPQRACQMIEKGYQFISLASDAAFMAAGASAGVKVIKDKAPPAPVGLRDMGPTHITANQGY